MSGLQGKKQVMYPTQKKDEHKTFWVQFKDDCPFLILTRDAPCSFQNLETVLKWLAKL